MATKKEKGNRRTKIVSKIANNPSFFLSEDIPKNKLRYEELISGFSEALNETPENDLETVLNSWIEKFVTFLKVDRCIVTEYMPDLKTMHVLLNYALPEAYTVPVIYEYQPFSGVIGELKKGIIIKAEKIPDDLPQIFRGGLIEKDNTKSLIIIPLIISDEVIGSLTFACYKKERKWSIVFLRRIKLIGEIIANAIQRIRSYKSFLEITEHGKQLEEKYSSILKYASVGFMISGLLDFSILDVNDEYCRMTGYSRDELLTKKVWEIDASGDSEKVKLDRDTMLHQNGLIHYETSHKKKDGNKIDVTISANYFEADGVVCSFINNVTELKKAQRELEDRLIFEKLISEFSAELINISPENIFNELDKWLKKFVELLNVDRGIINEHLYDINMIHLLINYSVPEIDIPLTYFHKTPSNVNDIFKKGLSIKAEKIPDDLPQGMRGGIVEKENVKSIVIVPIIGGNEILGNLTLMNYRNERRWPDDLVNQLKLIGEIFGNALLRKRSHETLIKEMEQRERIEERYSSIVKNANVGFSISDIDQNIIDVNDEYCRMSGYSRDELLAMKISDIDMTFSVLDEGILNEILTRNAIHHEVIHKKKDGSLMDIAVSSTLNTKEKTLYSFMRDITELNQAKREQDERLKFEEIISAFSASLLNIRPDKFKDELKVWLKKFVDLLKVDMGLIIEYQIDQQNVHALVHYTIPGLDIPIEKNHKTPPEIIAELKKGEIIHAVKIPDDLPPIYRGGLFEKYNTKSVIIVPLLTGDRVFGNITFAGYKEERRWSDGIIIRIKLIGEIIGNAILRIRANEALNQAQEDLRERLEFEEIISEFSTALINIKPDDILNELEKWFVKFINLMDADRCAVNEYSDDQQIIINLIQYSVPEVNVTIPDVRKTPEGEIDELKKGIIKVEKIPEDLPQMLQGTYIERSKAKSLIIIPLLTGNRIFGNLAITNYRKERKWSDELIRRIKLIGEIVGNAILRKRANDTLIEEIKSRYMLEEKYTSIIKNASVGFIISDQNHNILSVNDEYCRMSGYTHNELIKMKITDIDYSVNFDKVDNDKKLTVESGLYHHHTRQIRKDDSIFDVEVNSQFSEREGFIFSFIRDVTDLNNARRDLEDKLRFETLTTEFSATLINMDLNIVNIQLNQWLKKFVEFLDVDRGVVYEYQDDGKTFKSLINYTNPTIAINPPEELLSLPDRIITELKSGNIIRAEKIPDDLPIVFRGWVIEEHNTRSLVIVPLKAGNQILGNLTFATYQIEHEWSDETVGRINLIGEIIANAISRRRSSDALIAEMQRRQKLEERYTSIIKTANVGFWISDTNQNILVVNDEYCRMSGYSRDDLLTMKIADIDSSKDYEQIENDGADSISRGSSHRERKHIRKDGTVFDVEISTNYLSGEGLFFCFTRDITELNQAKKELVERLSFEELVSEFSAALINVKINNNKPELDNWIRRFSELLNVDRWRIGQYEENYGIYRIICSYINPHLDPKPPDNPMVMINDKKLNLDKYLIKGEILKLDSINDKFPEDLNLWQQLVRNDGTKSILMLPLMVGETLLGRMVIATFVHEKIWTDEIIRRLKLVAEIFANSLMREKKDSELDNYRKHLENMVEERTARLEETQKELVINEKMATLGKLTATVSHELRNPLGTIRTSVFSIGKRMKGQDDKVMAALDRAERNIRRCDLIIDELLNYSRVQALIFQSTNLDIWIREVVDETKPPSGISVKTELNAGVTIGLDQERFRRCMVNILTNAYQAIEEKVSDEPGNVIISTHKEKDKIILDISDNGVGFDMAIKNRLFEPLFSTKAFGVGLGIPITRQIIEQHGFQMDMKGEPMNGASVIITIPMIDMNYKNN